MNNILFSETILCDSLSSFSFLGKILLRWNLNCAYVHSVMAGIAAVTTEKIIGKGGKWKQCGCTANIASANKKKISNGLVGFLST